MEVSEEMGLGGVITPEVMSSARERWTTKTRPALYSELERQVLLLFLTTVEEADEEEPDIFPDQMILHLRVIASVDREKEDWALALIDDVKEAAQRAVKKFDLDPKAPKMKELDDL
jgi:hypothetical protein